MKREEVLCACSRQILFGSTHFQQSGHAMNQNGNESASSQGEVIQSYKCILEKRSCSPCIALSFSAMPLLLARLRTFLTVTPQTYTDGSNERLKRGQRSLDRGVSFKTEDSKPTIFKECNSNPNSKMSGIEHICSMIACVFGWVKKTEKY